MRAALCLAQDESFSSVTRMLACYEELTNQQWECVLWANPRQCEKLVGTTATIIQAPNLAPLCECAYAITSCDDLLAALGLSSEKEVWRHVDACCELLFAFAPDVIVTDLSPVAVMAARRLKVPQVASLRWTYHPANPVNGKHSHPEADLVTASLARVLRRIGVDCAPSAASLIHALPAWHFVPSIPPFEQGLKRTVLNWVGLLSSHELERHSEFITKVPDMERRLYTYLDPATIDVDDQLDLLAHAFADSEWHVIVAVPKSYNTGGLPQNIETVHQPPGWAVLDWCDVYLTHGGVNSLLTALALGRPVVCLPDECEERVANAAVMKGLGWAAVIGPSLPSHSTLHAVCDAARGLQGNARGVAWRRRSLAASGAAGVARQVTSLLGGA
jgi:hypothetical protein